MPVTAGANADPEQMSAVNVAAPRASRANATPVEELLESHALVSAYQPLVDLYDGETVGYEALARGPVGSALERPDALFEAARAAGVELEIEWECQRAALSGALAGGIGPGQALFVNFEPRMLTSERPAWLALLTEAALGRFALFAEVTERSLIDRPAELLSAVEVLRRLGGGIALDDVGADPRSLALMPFLAPDVIKLDLRLVHENPSAQIAEIAHAVGAEAERTGALVLAEGIETEAHRQTALGLGARYGQGWLFGRPGALAPPGRTVSTPIPVPPRALPDPRYTPFEVVTENLPLRQADKRLMLVLSMNIEAQASSLGTAAVVLSCFQDSRFFSDVTGARYSSLSHRAALVGALGVGLSEQPAPGVRGVALDRADPLRGEWDVTVIGPHFAMAFVARDLGDTGPDMERRFDFAITYDRELAIHASRAMMGRLAAV
jgi:EAL domain-containing protein (putative c-di-GMP-specific phosphodiesterase class I)